MTRSKKGVEHVAEKHLQHIDLGGGDWNFRWPIVGDGDFVSRVDPSRSRIIPPQSANAIAISVPAGGNLLMRATRTSHAANHGGGPSPIEWPNSSTQREAQFGEEMETPGNDRGTSIPSGVIVTAGNACVEGRKGRILARLRGRKRANNHRFPAKSFQWSGGHEHFRRRTRRAPVNVWRVRMLKKNPKAGALTRQKLSEAAYKSCPALSRSQARQIVDEVFEEILAALVCGESVKLSAFGVFTLRAKRERIGRNPKTGDPAIISARRVVTFHASPNLVVRMNGQIVQSLRG